jgi:hypothetical protein
VRTGERKKIIGKILKIGRKRKKVEEEEKDI